MLFGELCWNLCQIYLRYIKRSGGTTEPDHRCVQVDSRFHTPDQFVRHCLDPGLKEEYLWHLLIPTNLFLTMTIYFFIFRAFNQLIMYNKCLILAEHHTFALYISLYMFTLISLGFIYWICSFTYHTWFAVCPFNISLKLY